MTFRVIQPNPSYDMFIAKKKEVTEAFLTLPLLKVDAEDRQVGICKAPQPHDTAELKNKQDISFFKHFINIQQNGLLYTVRLMYTVHQCTPVDMQCCLCHTSNKPYI